ncbi:VOC family protein [Shewanella gelidii]|uniref:Glyoxalase n=1 Tax=Shewanella gelidii TaxID=1642821 RepID=A0A917JSP8_9GAMM|nr:VOC family protein [Shewanella gelidii]MCL1099089.1 VOC family protein [Shewanella gelidii]GGI81922.1 glyoxalase [Shewanella gelidii]
MKVETYLQGQPCWVELATTDWQGAKAFYQSMFGWADNDMPMPEGVYTMVHFDGDDVGALYQMPQQMLDEGTPTHWTIYFAVDSADDVVEAAKQAGGTVLAGPHDVGDAGRMAFLADPEGARFAVWQGKSHIGIKRALEHGTLCWSELASRDPEKAKAFYPQVIGWSHKSGDMPDMPYTHWQAAGSDVGGMIAMTEEWGDIPAHWMAYFQVDDCDAAAKKVVELGGKVCVPPTDIPNTGRFSVVNDPQGGVFSIFEMPAT